MLYLTALTTEHTSLAVLSIHYHHAYK